MLFNAGTWPSTINDPAEARNRSHQVALYEARIAADHPRHHGALSAHRSLVDRIRKAIRVAPSPPDAVACGAC